MQLRQELRLLVRAINWKVLATRVADATADQLSTNRSRCSHGFRVVKAGEILTHV
jgi:hypothetical protein